MENQTQAQVISTKDWIITILIASIPVVNLVMLFVWAFGSNENPNKSNFAKAALIWGAIWIVFCIVIGIFAGIFMAGFGGEGLDV